MATPNVLPDAPAALPAGSEAVSDAEVSLPDEVLQIPAVYGLLHGSPAAIYADMTVSDPELEILAQYAPQLAQSGIGFYPSKDKTIGVLFNGAYVDESQLAEADAAGKLTEVAAPYAEVKSQFDSAAVGAPADTAAAPIAAAPAANVGGPPPSSKTEQKLATARVKNLQPGSPTSGPTPGAGRILNNILKPTV